MKLRNMKIGDNAKVVKYLDYKTNYSRKLQELGISPGCILTLVSIAPGGDPYLLKIRGYRISLRKKEADILQLISIDEEVANA